ncbi:MAG: hypothetical protein MUO61_03470 [Dehalococcoidia bacterium]|nr:hypothetical protein [Dehalococcoidia bacterium]
MVWTAPKTWADGNNIPEADLNTHVRDNLLWLKTHITLGATSELTIDVTGIITVTDAYHTVDTFADAATDDLNTISGGTEGMIIFLRAANAARIVVIKNGTGNIYPGADISLNAVTKHIALIQNSAGNWVLLDSARDLTFCVNAFQYPLSGTDWTPELKGTGLAQSLTTKKVWLPLNFLKVGDAIISYQLNGDAIEVAALTLDCKLVRVNLADPLTTTDVAGGGITQIDADGDFSSEAVLTAPEVVAVDKQYTLEILGTTGAGDSITVTGAEVVIRRLV